MLAAVSFQPEGMSSVPVFRSIRLFGEMVSQTNSVTTVIGLARMYPNGVPPRSPGLATQEPTLGLVDTRASSTPTGLRRPSPLKPRILTREMTQPPWGWSIERLIACHSMGCFGPQKDSSVLSRQQTEIHFSNFELRISNDSPTHPSPPHKGPQKCPSATPVTNNSVERS